MKIAIAETDYVGLSYAVLLAQHNEVIALDNVQEKVNIINNKNLPITDKEMEEFLATKDLHLKATTDAEEAFKDATFIIISTPTNYNPNENYFETSSIETVIQNVLEMGSDATMVITSPIPVGYTKELKEKYHTENIMFAPNFLRKEHALYDILHPSRIIAAEYSERAKKFASLLAEGALIKDIPMVFIKSTEAEAMNLFAKAYHAMRVAFFNELDTYAELKGLDTKQIVKGISYDPIVGNYNNNPSFGYEGNGLPEDTKQLAANFKNVPNNIMTSIVEANSTRKDHIVERILNREPHIVGIYRPSMKIGLDDFSQSAVQDIIKRMKDNDVEVVLYEPAVEADSFEGLRVMKDFKLFKDISDVIVTSRMSDELKSVYEKVYTRNVFSGD